MSTLFVVPALCQLIELIDSGHNGAEVGTVIGQCMRWRLAFFPDMILHFRIFAAIAMPRWNNTICFRRGLYNPGHSSKGLDIANRFCDEGRKDKRHN